MMAIGMPQPDDKKVYNSTQLRRNCRTKINKKCGTKRGRKGDDDIQVNAAPDSIIKNSSKKDMLTSSITPNNAAKQTVNVRRSLFDASTPKSVIKTPYSTSGNKRKRELSPTEDPCKFKKIPDLSIILGINEFIELSDRRNDSLIEFCENDVKLANDDKQFLTVQEKPLPQIESINTCIDISDRRDSSPHKIILK